MGRRYFFNCCAKKSVLKTGSSKNGFSQNTHLNLSTEYNLFFKGLMEPTCLNIIFIRVYALHVGFLIIKIFFRVGEKEKIND
jgi:hypothetical protein